MSELLMTQPKLTAKSLHQWLETHKALPMFPSVITRLDEVLSAETIDVDSVVAVLQTDVSVVAHIMKTVNSARYVMYEPAHNLTEAVTRLGFSATRMVATAAAFMNLMATPKTFSKRDFWRTAFVSAVACREVVKIVRQHQHVFNPSSAFILGIASDLGVFLFDSCCTDTYRAIVEQVQDNPQALVRLEQQVLGIDHAIASAVLLRAWRFPETWVMGVAGHYFPARLPVEQQPWADALLIAENISASLGYGNGVCKPNTAALSELTESRLAHLGLTSSDFKQLTSRVAFLIDQEGWLALAEEVVD